MLICRVLRSGFFVFKLLLVVFVAVHFRSSNRYQSRHYAMPFRLFLAVGRIPIVVFGWPSGMMDGLAIATTPLAGLH